MESAAKSRCMRMVMAAMAADIATRNNNTPPLIELVQRVPQHQ
jgi:hypothetical protein